MFPNEAGRSEHPADLLIREILQSGRAVSADELHRILSRVAAAPFDRRIVPVPADERGLSHLGRTLGNREDSLFLHLLRRVVLDEEWAVGTGEAEYLEDVRRAAGDSSARLAIYTRRGEPMALIQAPNTLPASKLGPLAKPWLCAVYSADRGMLVSGYQSVGTPRGVPGDARWFR